MSDNVILAVSLAIPNLLAVLMGILVNNSRLNDTNARIGEMRTHMDQRFDDMRDMWRSELHRVEEILDARLKHLEER
ncbi:MAG: hypothetical protein ABIR70_18145 [Bryobacteraceae bacterium]